ncbi:GH36-type glycosyl hydrolase domain-containing protein [Pseudomonas nunensis]|uniref:Cyclic beta 1-2 glucan synthetase n=1 Tax=Pseudomonas nunensis TaxID=2961896 RepID=A0ABY5ERK1_9PSED|nr:glucoamylase family protein [Pseudomonas nunensis]KPN90561.1 NdvB [Pseudomonas nunensis]MCL5225430.1 cyclic beta 1-2 glucan synthetase [Pseudomonas nunensis]UTO16810.1 cyclic beta 1-2 glucan synthetase [Pseudomonas nunensis]
MTSIWIRASRLLSRLTAFCRSGKYRPLKFAHEQILRSELFNADQMASHGIALAGQHQLSELYVRDSLLGRLDDNEVLLSSSCTALIQASPTSRRITPAAEWLLDNYFLIEDHIRTARTHLPKGYSRELPRLINGPSTGLPRVYDIALETISHGDGRFDEHSLRRFIVAYQTVMPLSLGELWAVPIMLRLALIENLRRVASRVMANWDDGNLADDWAERLIEISERDVKSVVLTVADMAHSAPPLTAAFVAEFARRLQGQSAALALPLNWIEQTLVETGSSIERQVQLDTRQQSADQVSISNSIASLRLLSATNWREFVESMSLVEQTLKNDPAAVYPFMDFDTRDSYRHVIERLARRSQHSEIQVADIVVKLSGEQNALTSDSLLASHVGYFLIGAGIGILEQRLKAHVPLHERWKRLVQRSPLMFYLAPAGSLTVIFALPMLASAGRDGLSFTELLVLAVPCLIMTSQLAFSLINWLVTFSLLPTMLPKMDYANGVPDEARTLVAIPTLIASRADVEDLVEGLEVRFLANRDSNLFFALLTDFCDAPEEVQVQDADLLAHASQAISLLNRKYAEGSIDRFFLLHRPRCWNPGEQVWMGYERKRGKLNDLNALLRGRDASRFTTVVGDTRSLQTVRYVLTLDTDTQLPQDVARQCVAAMMHPLNWPVFDTRKEKIISGHALLQPRVGISLTSTPRSIYSRLLGTGGGVDPYTRAVSDIYQDLFHQGSFIGKGIYDVDAFTCALKDCLPDNQILSHDLIEGCYARSGLLSDVQLYEQYPSGYSADVKRRHRWIRGDWQLIPWILPWTRNARGEWARNRLDVMALWKILDNLRRSLEPLALLVMLAWGWFASSEPLAWTLAVIGLLVLQPLLRTLADVLQPPLNVPYRQYLAALFGGLAQDLAQVGATIAWLPFEMYYSAGAIARSLWRIIFSRRLLLQWKPSREVERNSANRLTGYYREMWIGPLFALISLTVLVTDPIRLVIATPLLLSWLAGPWMAWRFSAAPKRSLFKPSIEALRFLRVLTRRTWAFFDEFVGPQDNWLPPDNIQEEPKPAIAHRTSPTNMGMALLANLAAHDFGYLSTERLLRRLSASLDSMNRLERHQQHFYNWYDTQTLEPLRPHYISTVDSGNLAGLLLTLRAGLVQITHAPLFGLSIVDGLRDTLDALVENQQVYGESGQLYSLLDSASRHLDANSLLDMLQTVRAIVPTPQVEAEGDSSYWQSALIEQCSDWIEALERFRLPAPAIGREPRRQSLRDLAHLNDADWPVEHHVRVETVRAAAIESSRGLDRLINLTAALAQMDFSLLYDNKRDLFVIGYNAEERRLDTGYYDLLASEVRLTNFVVIAQGQIPQRAWFTLGRLFGEHEGVPTLMSWSGSMFEYLMPMLVMPNYDGSLLDQGCHVAVAVQIEQGHRLGLPWGVSESGYYTLDAHFNYQYRAFGVQALGLKRGLGDDIVVAPYASALALMVDAEAACKNLQRLAREGAAGRYGLYEAIDYTEARLPRGQRFALVQSFMAHHQGMSLLALTSVLLDQPMQRRFESDPALQSALLLLQERVPKAAAPYLQAAQSSALVDAGQSQDNDLRIFAHPGLKRPAVQLLSNGNYHVMLSSGGGGYSRRNDMAVTRWHEDITQDNWGTFCYLRDVDTGVFWSAAFQPTLRRTESHEAIFSDARAEFRTRELDFDTHMEIVVSPEDNIELRRLHITNCGSSAKSLEITTYAEVVLAGPDTDAMHPAFSKLFVQSELLLPLQAIVCSRRPRASDEPTPWMCHLLAAHDVDIEDISYETDRARFIGRGRKLESPAALDAGCKQLSGTAGPVLDPIVAIRCRVTLQPGQQATIDLVTGAATSRDHCLSLINKYRDRHLADRVFDLSWTHSQVLLRQLNASHADARLFEQMASSLLYANAAVRADSAVLIDNRRNQQGLWGQSISGDRPIVLLKIKSLDNIELVRKMIQAHAYWRQKGLVVDLLVWNEDPTGYRQQLQDAIMGLVTSGSEATLVDRSGGIFVRTAQQMSNEDRTLILSVARLVLSEGLGSLAEQIHRRRVVPVYAPFVATRQYVPIPTPFKPLSLPLSLSNAYGGFSEDGSEYVINSNATRPTPAPWVNVIANAQLGTVVSDTGSAYTWAENAHEFRLTPWHNDPIIDPSGEVIYLRDEETGHFWSATPKPCPGTGSYQTRHGFGYSVFEHEEDGIQTELWVFVATDAPIKFSRLIVRNVSGRNRKLTVTGYVEWVLGDLRSKSAMHVVTQSDPVSGAFFARNAYSIEFNERVAFFDTDGSDHSISGDRTEFIGRNGSLESPSAMQHAGLSGRIGAGLDPCAAIQVTVALADGESTEVVLRMGAEKSVPAATQLVQRYRGVQVAAAELQKVREHWRSLLSVIQVQTPAASFDVMVNGWLMYQVIACRFLARSGYYQSGGAIGFRDQLQDSMAMIHADPATVRSHLLLCASHQYQEGDVQHWWHPPLNRGVRTACSDDFLWLVAATSRYVEITDDLSVLDEPAGYLEGRALNTGEESYYDLPGVSDLREPLYQHCMRAIEHSLRRGMHGLPLIGSGDWNDGMNRVGYLGRGESVWLGFFGCHVLKRFALIAARYGDDDFARRCDENAILLRDSLEKEAWDGAWYRRAWFDDEQPLGSSINDECRIDSIAQSWSVLSGGGSATRQRLAMRALDQYLVKPEIRAILLLDPPFDKGELDPGYIKGYVPGVRENGGQYTHAAVWAAMAFAQLGDSVKAWELLSLINPAAPLNNARIDTYKVEPYVMAADVYGTAPHAGRGGWTWYTGSAGWMYRLGVESLLGLQRNGNTLRLEPLIPEDWPGFTLTYRFGLTEYHFEARQGTTDTTSMTLDGHPLEGGAVVLIDDGVEHRILVDCRKPLPRPLELKYVQAVDD